MAGQFVLLTGGTSGIGAIGARELARAGATIGIVGRDAGRTRRAAEALRAASGNESVIDFPADLSSLSEVRRLSETVGQRFPKLDVLVNDAGAIFSRRATTPEGIERTWALNVLAPFLLTRLFESHLLAAPAGRVVNVSSVAHTRGRLRLDDLERVRSYSAWGAYAQSKLALLMLSYAWARRWSGSRATINALHPGFVASRFGRENPGAFGWGMAFVEALFAISPERGARTLVYLASAPEVAGISGRYFVRSREHRSSTRSYDRALGDELWARCWAQTASFAPPLEPA